MKYIVLILSLLFSGCVSTHRVANSKMVQNKYNILYNEGTICLVKDNRHKLDIFYYPLNSKCKSSSLYSWKMNSIDSKLNANNLVLESYSLYKKSNSLTVKKDCAGAGVKVKKIQLRKNPTDIYWGKLKIANSNFLSRKVCFKKIGAKYFKIKDF